MPIKRETIYNAGAWFFLVGIGGLFIPATWWRQLPLLRAPTVALTTAEKSPAAAVAPFRFPATASQAYTAAQQRLAQLGRSLFFDTRLSANGQVSCATCHQPGRGFTDGRVLPRGQGEGARHAPTLINAFAQHWFFWDGRAENLAQQALGPLEDPAEHGYSRLAFARLLIAEHAQDLASLFGPLPADAAARLAHEIPTQPSYVAAVGKDVASYGVISWNNVTAQHRLVAEAYQKHMAPQNLLLAHWHAGEESSATPPASDDVSLLNDVSTRGLYALAAFVAAQRSVASPFDHFAARLARGDTVAASLRADFPAEAWRGFQLFTTKAHCHLCHGGPNFSDQEFHNTGITDDRQPWPDLGRALALRRMDPRPAGCTQPTLVAAEERYRLGIITEACRELPYMDGNNVEMVGAFKTPTLRNLAATAPYMHNGSLPDLEAVIEHYDKLKSRVSVGHRTETLTPLGLSAGDKEDLLAFLRSLNGPLIDVSLPRETTAAADDK